MVFRTLIENLRVYETKYPKLLRDYNSLYLSLNDFDSIIGLTEIKQDIMTTIQHIIVQKVTGTVSNDMYHTVLCSSPGTGKTTVIGILARIWDALDLIEPIHNVQENVIRSRLQRMMVDMRNYREELYKIGLKPYKMTNIMKDVNNMLKEFEPRMQIIRQAKVTYFSREDLVAEYMGQSAMKTRKALVAASGGVVVIDEAYKLFNMDRDAYGMEVLSVINEHMSLYPRNFIFIFAGYPELMNETIFRVQPGLQRRFRRIYKLPVYTHTELVQIFKSQIKIPLDEKIGTWMEDFMRDNYAAFPFYGGDTQTLALECRVILSGDNFISITNGVLPTNIITSDVIKRAFKSVQSHKTSTTNHEIINTMYQ